MPQASRRAVLAAAGLGAVATGLAPAPAMAASIGSVPSREPWTAVRGRTVVLKDASSGGQVRARVREVNDLVGAPSQDLWRYGLILAPVAPLPDGIYRIAGRGFTNAALFFSNVDREVGAGLQAVVHANPR